MITSSRHLARAAAVVLLLGIGTGMASAQAVIVERAMPAPIVEVVPARPSPNHMWVKGHHVFEGGRWNWTPGVWVRL